MTPHVRWSVGHLSGWSVCHDFLKGREVTLPLHSPIGALVHRNPTCACRVRWSECRRRPPSHPDRLCNPSPEPRYKYKKFKTNGNRLFYPIIDYKVLTSTNPITHHKCSYFNESINFCGQNLDFYFLFL